MCMIKDCYQNYTKKLLKLNIKKTAWFKNRPKIFTNTSPKKIYRWKINKWKKSSTSYVIREMQMKTKRYRHTPNRMARPGTPAPPSADEEVEPQNPFVYCWRDREVGIAVLKDSLAVSYKTILSLYNPAIVLLGIYPEELKTMSTQKPAQVCL